MENSGTLILGVTCGLLCVAGSYYFVNTGSLFSRKAAVTTVKKPIDDEDDKLFPAGRMFVYFGSQTGTAEGFARTIEKEGIARGFNARRVDLDDFDPAQLEKARLTVFLMATYGEGESTDNAMNFNNWMSNQADEDRSTNLKDVSFTVFGLGNRQYEHFNRMGKKTNEVLHNYGAKRVFDYGEGDDDGTLEEDFEKWKTGMWTSLVKQYHPNSAAADDQSIDEEKKVQLSFRLAPASSSSTAHAPKGHHTKPLFQAKVASVTANRELRSVNGNEKDVGSTRCIEINLEGTGLTYNTADNLAVMPENDHSSVATLAKALGYTLDERYSIQNEPASGKENVDEFPSPFTAREALTRYFDIHGIPRASILTQLLPYITESSQRDWLRKLVAKDNRPTFKQYMESGGRTVFELLTNELASCKIPLEDFMHIIPHMQPRYYTISSSSSCYPTSVHITVSVTEMSFSSGKKVKGLCSSYLQNLVPNQSTCRAFVRPSTFKLPKSLSTPIIMIGPGTGIAPMRALLQERKFRCDAEKLTSKNTLYFGCKKRDVDYLYKDEIEDYVKNKTLSSLHLAFSREQKQKVYVQEIIRVDENGKDLVADLENGGHLYVCGGTIMGSDVMEVIIQVLSAQKNIGRNEAMEYVKDLQQNGRYVQELWSIA